MYLIRIAQYLKEIEVPQKKQSVWLKHMADFLNLYLTGTKTFDTISYSLPPNLLLDSYLTSQPPKRMLSNAAIWNPCSKVYVRGGMICPKALAIFYFKSICYASVANISFWMKEVDISQLKLVIPPPPKKKKLKRTIAHILYTQVHFCCR